MHRDPPNPARLVKVFTVFCGVAGLVMAAAFFLLKHPWTAAGDGKPKAHQDSPAASPTPAPVEPGKTVPNADQGTISPSGVFSTAVPDFVNPDYQAAAVDPSTLGQKASELVVSEGADRARIGMVTIDRKSRTISFPARLNMQSGLLEYALVTAKGKAHEALLTTEALPLHVHLAAVLLQIARPEGGGEPAKVSIEVEWQANGPARRVPLESLIARAKGVALDPVAARAAEPADDVPSTEPGDALEPGPWDYCGSTVRRGALMAAAQGSVISLLKDPDALVCNPRPGNNNDRLHVPGAQLPPAPNFPVVIHLRPYSAPNPD